MSRTSTLHPTVRDRIKELRSTGRTREQIQTQLAAEGVVMSTGAISNVCRGGVQTKPPGSPVATDAAPVARRAEGGDESDPATQLRELARLAKELATVARAEGNLSGFTQCVRTISLCVAQAEKLTPPTPPDPEANPDWIAAAKRAREKLHDMLNKALKGAA